MQICLLLYGHCLRINLTALNLPNEFLQVAEILSRQSVQKARDDENLKPGQDLDQEIQNQRIDWVETSLKESSRVLSLLKFKVGAIMALVLFIVLGPMNSLFEGKVVAKLPFKPIGIVMKMSHRGMQGDDSTDCLMAFLYLLCSICICTNLHKFSAFSPLRGAAPSGLVPIPNPKTN